MGSGGDVEDMLKDEKNPPPLDEDDIALLKTYVSNPLSLSKP
jgi:26S proteasome regulatory subunit T1